MYSENMSVFQKGIRLGRKIETTDFFFEMTLGIEHTYRTVGSFADHKSDCILFVKNLKQPLILKQIQIGKIQVIWQTIRKKHSKKMFF